MHRRILRWWRARPLWLRVVLAVAALGLAALLAYRLLGAAGAGVSAFLAALLGLGRSRLARPGATGGGRALGRAEAQVADLADALHEDARDMLDEADAARGRDAAADAALTSRVEAATAAVPDAPPPGWSKPPRVYDR